MRWFNTAGPCKPHHHYIIPAQQRLPNLERTIAQENYFVIHAPRQTGKTTAMLALAQSLTAAGNYTALMVSAEVGAAYGDSPDQAQRAMLIAWQDAADFWLPDALKPPSWSDCVTIGQALSRWCRQSPRPIVLLIDEIDALQDNALITVLRQLRDGYSRRPQGFPQSLGLIGLRDVRDYKVAAGGSSRLGTASPFNVKVRSLTLNNFTLEQVTQLYRQHTEDTGQVFVPEAIQLAFDLTQGQPWLVNALAKEIVEEIEPNLSVSITPEHVQTAKEILIQRQDTHLDSLAERLRENRVQAVIEPILGGHSLGEVSNDDRQYLVDLGLLRRESGGDWRSPTPSTVKFYPGPWP